MMHVLPCERVRADLEAFVDGELSLDHQVSIQSHLHECVACQLEVSELSTLGEAMRAVPAHADGFTPDGGRLTSIIIERVRLEQQLSIGVQLRDLFDDMHFVWAGLGATVAMVVCFFASAGVLHATSRERPDSLAGLIDYLANPGSNANPVRLFDHMSAPRATIEPSMPVHGEDTELALAAVVTREGRVQNLALVDEPAPGMRMKPAQLSAMLDAASRARFEPARAGGETVAVNMVWLLSSTTVKGRPDYDMYLLRPPVPAVPASGPIAPLKRRGVAPIKVAAPTGDGCAAG